MPASLHSLDRQDRDRLWKAVLIATVLHLMAILGIGFEWLKVQPASAIEVTLVHQLAKQPIDESERVASHDAEGGGQLAERTQLTTDRKALLDDSQLRDTEQALPPLEAQQARQEPLTMPVSASGAGPEQPQQLQEGSQQLDSPANPLPANIASLRAQLADQQAAYSRIPTTRILTGASARAADDAEYLHSWIEWVESIGNQNYPEEARRKRIFGAVRLAVTINRDGSVAGVEILHSSGQRVLDQAAVRIVRLAMPFAPIPDTISEDRLEIIRTWHFSPGHHFASE